MSSDNKPGSIDQGRRRFLKTTSIGASAVLVASVLPRHARADDLPHLQVTDPTAAALGYTEDTNTVDDKKFPMHKPTQDCANCKFFTAGSGEYGPCQLFPGKSVHTKGWCSAHANKA
ncbi:MAG: high-potential iron-sulfur protein [Dokdonella sp.]|uniref:high-potential iron-sulfur protein n=1 Tax=Dokdonella sp. TaxID=2291710 RepID=UPI0025C37B28|nr:high-potential iron-sulfur protein [Dokdonella sp.]MBX3699707.1 high-potential iron-sulfur protein [Dokdonella sp.]MCW5579465.1 high-potential iron-sulfur protein [Dokdonella sp.]